MYLLTIFLIAVAAQVSQTQPVPLRQPDPVASKKAQSDEQTPTVRVNVPNQLDLKIEEKEKTQSFSWYRALELAVPAGLGSILTILGVFLNTKANARENEKNRQAAKEQHERELVSRVSQSKYENGIEREINTILAQVEAINEYIHSMQFLNARYRLERGFDENGDEVFSLSDHTLDNVNNAIEKQRIAHRATFMCQILLSAEFNGQIQKYLLWIDDYLLELKSVQPDIDMSPRFWDDIRDGVLQSARREVDKRAKVMVK
jgi:hypothetical protein